MMLSLALLAALAGQSPAPAPVAPGSAAAGGIGRAFVSPMGEPFFSSAGSNDGLASWFAQVDANRDQSISAEEMSGDADRFFDRLDGNKDGEIDPDEMTVYEQTIQARSGRYSLLNIPQPVISADTNFNRGVSREEFRAAASKRFKTLDVNGSGMLTLAALDEIRQAASAAAKRPNGKVPYIPLNPKQSTEGINRRR